jgi:uncharacterized iron-regulated protein
MRAVTCLAIALWGAVAQAQTPDVPKADIYVLGEVHDNPAHHLMQAEIVARVRPTALVFEMLTPSQAAASEGVDRSDASALDAAFGWEAAGWPPFAMYAPIFAGAPDATIIGAALTRDVLMEAAAQDAASVFGEASGAFGLTPLDAADLDARVAEQAEAHCGAMPAEMLPGMVEVQRLRDATFARAAIDAFDAGGGPVVLITGTGHARTDRGVPAYIRKARPDLTVWALGQVEGAPEAGDPPYDAVVVTDPVERDDPCAAFAAPKG